MSPTDAPIATAPAPAADLTPPDLAALVGSRICHDLISPLGAIGNGVELLALTGGGGGEEMTLISESVENAAARIRYFRVAFGAAEAGQTLSRQEVVQTLSDVGRAGKVRVSWRAPGDVQRVEAKLVFLVVMCLESAMPFGGTVEARPERGRWRITGSASKLRVDPAAWALMTGGEDAAAPTASHVHFALAPAMAQRIGRTLRAEIGPDRIEVSC